MNSTNGTSAGLVGPNNFGSFGYGLGVSIGIVLLIITITLASYFCTRTPSTTIMIARQEWNLRGLAGDQSHAIDVGLDEATISSYPKLLYSEVKVGWSKDSTSTCCSICLADYKGSDTLRALPECRHLFHMKCVDTWLRLHPTCPVCRTSPLPTPLSTPLAEVIPLASRRD